MRVGFNTVGGYVHVFRNTGAGFNDVIENVVEGSLRCTRNDDPFVGGPNFAGGDADVDDGDPSDPHNQCLVVALP